MADYVHELRAELKDLREKLEHQTIQLNALAQYLPVLQEAFAGKIGGTHDAVSDHMSLLENLPSDVVQQALDNPSGLLQNEQSLQDFVDKK